MLRLILTFGDKGQMALDAGVNLSDVISMPVRERIGRAKYVPEDSLKYFDEIEAELADQADALINRGGY